MSQRQMYARQGVRPRSIGARHAEAARAVEDYVARRERAGQLMASSARNQRSLLGNWARFVDDWRHPTQDELLDWCSVPKSPDGKHQRASTVRSFIIWQEQRNRIPVGTSAWVPSMSGSKKRPKPIPDKVLHQAFRDASPALHCMYVLGRFAGLRASEIAAVHADDLSAGELYVVGKGGRERWVSAHPQVIEVVSASDGWVFPGNGPDGHMTGPSVSMARELPPPWTAHTLRHAFATELYEKTKDLVLVAEQLGHASVKTTERYVKSTGDPRAAVHALRLQVA